MTSELRPGRLCLLDKSTNVYDVNTDVTLAGNAAPTSASSFSVALILGFDYDRTASALVVVSAGSLIGWVHLLRIVRLLDC